MAEENNGGAAITAFLLGGLVGVVAGLLLAPRSGRDTRRRVGRWLEDLEEKGGDVLERGRELFEEGREAVQEQAQRVKRAVDTGRKAWEDGSN